jgi:hypothetical protein
MKNSLKHCLEKKKKVIKFLMEIKRFFFRFLILDIATIMVCKLTILKPKPPHTLGIHNFFQPRLSISFDEV